MMKPRTKISRSLLLALGWLLAGLGYAQAGCESIDFDEQSYTVCNFDAATDDIRLFHADSDGAPLGSFRAVENMLAPQGKSLNFAMNGGMYHPDRSPVGLYLERGKQTAGLVKRAGPGNFGLLPNGVFCIADGSVSVVETLAFANRKPDCVFASQSGPMLVIDGALHPRFIPDSDSRFVRNGVGVAADGQTVYFAISDERVNFDAFGRLFRDKLGTPNALYFDGKVSRLFAPDIGRADGGFALGPIVGVVSAQ